MSDVSCLYVSEMGNWKYDYNSLGNQLARRLIVIVINYVWKNPYGYLKFFPKQLGIFNQFLHTYYTIIFTLDYKFSFKYLQLWQSYAILSATT